MPSIGPPGAVSPPLTATPLAASCRRPLPPPSSTRCEPLLPPLQPTEVVFLLDVGPTMHPHLGAAARAASGYLMEKARRGGGLRGLGAVGVALQSSRGGGRVCARISGLRGAWLARHSAAAERIRLAATPHLWPAAGGPHLHAAPAPPTNPAPAPCSN